MMIYTIALDLSINSNKILSESEIQQVLKELIDSTTVTSRNIRLLEVND